MATVNPSRVGGGGGGREASMLIGGAHTCPGVPELQPKEPLLEEGWLGPLRGRQTEVSSHWVQSWA